MSIQDKAYKFSSKILVVDDERLVRMVICASLKKAGYDTVAAASVNEAVSILKAQHNAFCAILSDIMMGDMDGFVFRDIVRGLDQSIPIFFMTALDPEEGSGFLKKIIDDPMSFYLPKSAGTELLVTRVQRIVASRRVEQFIVRQIEETNQALKLASYVQSSMLPQHAGTTASGFYSIWWRPKETVSGDLFDTVRIDADRTLYVLGDVQGHGTSAALAMTAVQSTLRRIVRGGMVPRPCELANMLHAFFLSDLKDVSYMTALVCLHDAKRRTVQWISCGAPDPAVFDKSGRVDINPEKRGGLPIGLMPDTRYDEKDEVLTRLPHTAVCLALTDGVFDLSQSDGVAVNSDFLDSVVNELAVPSLENGSATTIPHKIMTACEEAGYVDYGDDVTLLAFGNRPHLSGVFETSVGMSPHDIDEAARALGAWCSRRGWDGADADKLQLVLEEKLMNIHDHGFDERERLHHVAGVRLRKVRGDAELTVWDCGTAEPSIAVAAGDSDTSFELLNRAMDGHGRGRLMIRELCSAIARNSFGLLNETIYYLPIGGNAAGAPEEGKDHG